MTDYDIQEQFLRNLAKAYQENQPNYILPLIAEDFTYDSLWVLSQMTSKKEYEDYIIPKMNVIKKSGQLFNFCIMENPDKKPYLIFTPKTPKEDFGCFYVETNSDHKISALHLMSSSFFNLRYKNKDEFNQFKKNEKA